MLTTLFLTTPVYLALMFLFMSHPLAMGLMLLIQTLLIALSLGLTLPSFWFSYVLFLVFLGGMLVLFIYVASLASNEMFSLSPSMVIFMSLSILIAGILMFAVDPLLHNSPLEFNFNHNMSNLTNSYSTFVLKMYHNMNYVITLMMIIYLLLTLIIIANIVTIQEGPLRPST